MIGHPSDPLDTRLEAAEKYTAYSANVRLQMIHILWSLRHRQENTHEFRRLGNESGQLPSMLFRIQEHLFTSVPLPADNPYNCLEDLAE